MFDPATLDEIEKLKNRTHALRRIEYVPASRVVTVRRNGRMIVRVMGAGGGGGGGGLNTRGAGGNAGTVGVLDVRVVAGAQYTVTIPASAAGGSGNQYGQGNDGVNGGMLTVAGPGVSINVPGGKGGRGGGKPGGPGANDDPSGLDVYFAGREGASEKGGSARRFWGGSTAPEIAEALGGEFATDDDACILCVPIVAGGRFGLGGGNTAGSGSAGSNAGRGGGGAGGSPGGSGFGQTAGSGGHGGLAWVTLEFLEDDHVR